METISKYGAVRELYKPPARCRGSKKEQTTQRTIGTVADGFLKHRFLPLCCSENNLCNAKQIESGFFKSLQSLAKVYNCTIPDYKHKPYPSNILLSHWDIVKQFKAQGRDISVSAIQSDGGSIQIMLKQFYNTGSTLYFIPVIPLYRLLQDKQQRKAGALLLSVFAYLHKIADIPYYRDEFSGLKNYYEMIEEWIMNDGFDLEEKEWNEHISETNAAKFYGDIIHRKISNPCHLQWFEERLNHFAPSNRWENKCWMIAKEAYRLFSEYSAKRLMQNMKVENETDYTEEDYYETIRAEQYISFIADTSDSWLTDQVEQTLNNEFNECRYMEEPMIEQVFDGCRKNKKEDLKFEFSLFELLKDLAQLLNEIP